MSGSGPRAVLVVSDRTSGDVEPDSVGADVSVTVLGESNDVFDELTNGVYDCLVLPGEVDGQSGLDLA